MPEAAIDKQMAMNWADTDLYRFFALVFARPSRECFEFLARPAVFEDLKNLGQFLGCKDEKLEFTWFPTFDLYEAAYISVFDVGLPEPAVPLFESAHDKSHPAQEVALENTYFYDVLGLKANPMTGVPDYLITQLEFLAALTFTKENTSDDATRVSLGKAKEEFLERHLLNWIPVASAKLKRTAVPGFPALMDMLVQFLRAESRFVREENMRVRPPAPRRCNESSTP